MTDGEKALVDAFMLFARENHDVQRRHFGKFVVSRRLYRLLQEKHDDRAIEYGLEVLGPNPGLMVHRVPVESEGAVYNG